MRFAHSLVIGGTGMLAAATHSLVDASRVVTLLARRPERLANPENAAEEATRRLIPVALDLAHRTEVLESLRRQIDRYGPIERAILWIHSQFEDTAIEVLRLLDETSPSRAAHAGSARPATRVVRVLGSAAGDPSSDLTARLAAATVPHLDLRAAILGFEIENGVSRWLTHDEIAGGVLALLERDRVFDGSTPRTAEIAVIGRIEPWSARP